MKMKAALLQIAASHDLFEKRCNFMDLVWQAAIAGFQNSSKKYEAFLHSTITAVLKSALEQSVL